MGFMVDNINGMVFSQALRLLARDIDKAMGRGGPGHPMRPFELIGLALTMFSGILRSRK